VTTRAGYWIGGLLIACSVVGAILWGVAGVVRIDDTVEGFERVPIPGARTVSLPADKVILYVEGPRADELTPSVGVTVEDPGSEDRVPVASYGGSLTYSFGTTGTAVGTVTPPRAGRYVVRTTSATPGSYNLAIGDSIAGRIVGAILGAFAVGGVLALAGIGLIVATSIRRSRRRAAAQEPPNPFGR
jgi:hypothetical protein